MNSAERCTVLDYDPEGDSLFIRVKPDTYGFSKREGNLIIDYGVNSEVIGFEVLNASKFFDDIDVSELGEVEECGLLKDE